MLKLYYYLLLLLLLLLPVVNDVELDSVLSPILVTTDVNVIEDIKLHPYFIIIIIDVLECNRYENTDKKFAETVA